MSIAWKVTVRPEPIKKLAEEFKARSDMLFRRFMLKAERSAVGNVSGKVLQRRTSRLARSITHTVSRTGNRLVGRLGSNVVYARIHELGGVIPAHVVKPKKAKVLRFTVGGETVFARKANIPPIRMKKRPYLRPAINEHKEWFATELKSIAGKQG